jgi:hypothetical protein
MSDARKIGADYKAISKNVNAPVSHSKPPDKVEIFEQQNFEQQFCCYLVDNSSFPGNTTPNRDDFSYLNHRSRFEKKIAVGILLENAKKFVPNCEGFYLESYVLRNLSLIALAVDVCLNNDSDCLVKIIDDMCAILLEDSKVRAYISGNLILSNDVKKGFQIITEGGEKDGFWHCRRNNDAFLILDLKVLALSEMMLSDGKTTPMFKSLPGLRWAERAKLKRIDPSLIIQHTHGLIEDKRWCAANCESYLINLIDMTDIWAAGEGWSHWLLQTLIGETKRLSSTICRARSKLLEMFCGEKTETMFFNLSDEDFAQKSRAVFKHICDKLLNLNILEFATRVVGEFVLMLDKSFLDHKVLSAKRSRCLSIVRGMLEQIFLHLFQLSSSRGKLFWASINALQELIQEHEATEANSFFQVRTRRLSLSCSLFLDCIN